jgi:hypothetical protein
LWLQHANRHGSAGDGCIYIKENEHGLERAQFQAKLMDRAGLIA